MFALLSICIPAEYSALYVTHGFCGRVLKRETTLAEQGISNGFTMHVSIRVRGGMLGDETITVSGVVDRDDDSSSDEMPPLVLLEERCIGLAK